MHSVSLSLILALGAVPSGGGDLARAQREIEEQLRQAVRIPEPQLDVEFEGLDASRYVLKDAAFSLDGVELPVEPGSRRVFQGEVKPGRHAIDVRLVYEERRGLGIFTYADAKLTVEGSLGVKSERGLATRLLVRVRADPKADPQHRLKLASDLSAEMLAKVDDSVGDLLATQRHVETAAVVEPAATPVPPPAAGEPTRGEAPLAAASTTPHTHRHVVREVLALKSRKIEDLPSLAQTASPAPTASRPVANATATAIETPSPVPTPTRTPTPTPTPTSAAGASPPSPEGPGRLAALVAVAAGALLLVGLFVVRLRRA